MNIEKISIPVMKYFCNFNHHYSSLMSLQLRRKRFEKTDMEKRCNRTAAVLEFLYYLHLLTWNWWCSIKSRESGSTDISFVRGTQRFTSRKRKGKKKYPLNRGMKKSTAKEVQNSTQIKWIMDYSAYEKGIVLSKEGFHPTGLNY